MQDYGVKTFFCAPTAFRAIKGADPQAQFAKKYDLSTLENLFLAGECFNLSSHLFYAYSFFSTYNYRTGEHCDPDTLKYCQKALSKYGSPVTEAIDHWWQTGLGFPAI